MIPYGKQDITQQDIDSVVDVLKSDFLTQGPQVPAFEKSLMRLTGAEHAVCVNSATSALHIACLALGVGPGDIVWTSPITFVASANCALYCGAKIDFVDIDRDSNNISIGALEEKLKKAKQDDKLPSVIIPVHMGGFSCDMQSIYKLSIEYGFKIIEDASHAIGGRYQGVMVGSCEFSDIAVFSFHPVKIITTAEGGAALTNNKQLAEKLTLLRSHGITRDPNQMIDESEGNWYYQQVALGFNYRMTDLQAALGSSQITRVELFIQKRNELAKRYHAAFAGLPLEVPIDDSAVLSSYHLYIIKLSDKSVVDRYHLYNYLRDKDIGVNVHYIPVHLQPYYKDLGFSTGDFPEAERYYEKAISLPLFPQLTYTDQDYVISKVIEAMV
jgi:UDP-4-amino-4,6-dideoxy-N-acetyl-beta-L-altrosamine transaminase